MSALVDKLKKYEVLLMNFPSQPALNPILIAQNLRQRTSPVSVDEQTINQRLIADINNVSKSNLPLAPIDLHQVLCLLKLRRLMTPL